MAIKRLYNHKVFFRLTIDGTKHLINEPVGWDGVSTKFPRDKDYFGFVVDAFDDDVQIGFGIDDIAYDLIEAIYERDGGDAVIGFEFGYYEDFSGVEKIPFIGNLNLNTRKREDNQIKCSIEKQSFKTLFRTRFDTVVDLSSSIDLDGKPIPPPQLFTAYLHSKAIIKQFVSEVTAPQESSSGVISRFVSVKMDSSYEVTTELQTNQQIPLSVNGIDPVDDSLYFFKIAEAGTYDLNFKANFNLRIFRPDFAGSVGNWELVPRFRIQRGGAVIDEVVLNAFRKSGSTSSKEVEFNMNFEFNLNRTLQVGDNLYLDCTGTQQYSGAPYIYYVTNYTNKNSIKAQTTAAESTTSCYRLFDVYNYLIGATTGQQNSLISKILGFGGECYDYIVANGYQIRNFLTTDKPLKMSLKDFHEKFFPVFGFGYGFKTIGGKEYVECEAFEKFFNKVPIMTLDEIHNYSEEHRKEDVFNEFQFGFEKYPEDDTNTLDEFNTYSDGLTPIKRYKAKFTKKSGAITSGYLIEEQRREQFAENPSTSLTNDDEIFLISVINDSGILVSEKDENFTNITGILDPGSVYNLRISLARIKYNWSRFLNIGLTKKANTDVLKTTFIKNNDKLSSILKSTDPRRRFEPQGNLVESGDVPMNVFRGDNRSAIHQAIEANFKAVIAYDEYMLIKDSLQGNSLLTSNHGCVVHPDDKGNVWLSHVYNMDYTFPTGEATFQVALIEEFVPYVEPPVVLPPVEPSQITLAWACTEGVSPYYIDQNLQIKVNGVIQVDSFITEIGSLFVNPGDEIDVECYTIEPSEQIGASIFLVINYPTGDIPVEIKSEAIPSVPGASITFSFTATEILYNIFAGVSQSL